MCGSTVNAVELYHFMVAVAPPKLLFLQRLVSQTSLLFLWRDFFQESSLVYFPQSYCQAKMDSSPSKMERKNKYLCSLCCPNKKCKKRTESSTWHVEWQGSTSVKSLIRNLLKAEKLNGNFSKYIKAEWNRESAKTENYSGVKGKGKK